MMAVAATTTAVFVVLRMFNLARIGIIIDHALLFINVI